MQEVAKFIPGSGPSSYFNNLLEKNKAISQKVEKYVTLKNVQISDKIETGQEQISNRQSDIKVMKMNSQNDQKRIKQNSSQNNKTDKKILIIENGQQSLKPQSEEKNVKKEISEQQRMKFVKQKIRENKLIAKRKDQLLQKEKEQQLKERQKQQEVLLQKQEEERKRKIEITKRKIQLIEKRKQQRILQNQKTNEILMEKSKEKILADKLHQQFLSHQSIILDEKKKKLAEIRQLHKPIDRQDFQDHIKKIQDSRIQRSTKKSLQRNKTNTSSQKKSNRYKSAFHEFLEKQEKEKQDEENQQRQRLRQLRQKGKKYAQDVKIQFMPQIDQKKREEIEKRNKTSLIAPDLVEYRLKGKQYLQFTKEYALKFKKQTTDSKDQKSLVRQESNKSQTTDYLALARKNAESRLKRSATSTNDFIRNIEAKKLTPEQKQEKILEFAERIERKARQKQKLLSAGNLYQSDLQVDKLYVSAIQAKLKALQR